MRLCNTSSAAAVLLVLSASAASSMPGFDGEPRGCCFEPNQGQADPRARFLLRLNGGAAVHFTPDEAISVLAAPPGSDAPPSTVHMKWLGANPETRIEGLDRRPGRVHDLGGRAESDAIVGVPRYAALRYARVYPGVDLVFHLNGSQLEYD